MTSEYLRHEYTWSNHCITGNVLGWGMTASSCPKDRDMLRELEKTASAAEPERAKGIPVEELSFVPLCGFVKMTVIPWDSGEDNRKNKKVFLYQPKETSASPGVYMAPRGFWEDQPQDGYLPAVKIEERTERPEDIFIKMHVYDRLPDFLRAVFWCLFEKKQGLNFAAPSWKQEEFAENAGVLMYAIHSILPSREPLGENCINLSEFEKQEFPPVTSKLEEYFFYHLSEFLVKKDDLYDKFWSEAEQYLKTSTGGNEERKLQWLFYMFCQKHGKESLEKNELLPGMPELFYWASREPALKTTTEEKFAGWYKDPQFTKEFTDRLMDDLTPGKEGTGTITIYAKWNDACTISFETNGGSACAPISTYEEETLRTPHAGRSPRRLPEYS